jgi:hypothetical protein
MSNFIREARYYVIKQKNLTEDQDTALCDLLSTYQVACTDCVVVEKHWRNYEHTWKTIEHVASGKFCDPYEEIDRLEARLAELEHREDAMCDLHYANGAKQGFSWGQVPDEKALHQCVSARMSAGVSELVELRKAGGSSAAWLLRQKADAVDQAGSDIGELIFLSKNPGEVSGFNMSAGVCEIYASRLRKDADAADKAGGGE